MTNWRGYGDIPYIDFTAELQKVHSPMLPEASAIYEAVKGHSRLFLAMAWHETKHATRFDFPGITAANKNPVALMTMGYARFPSWEYAAREWMNRLIHEASTYKGGVYARTVTLEDLIHVYAPASAGNDEARYVAVLKERIAAYGFTKETPVSDQITFGRVENPGFYDRPIWKPEGVGQNNLGDRVLRGIVLHRMVGTLDGTDTYFRLPSVTALTDWGVGTAYDDGKPGIIYRWNSVDTNQSGWASGPWENGSPRGAAFVRKYGVNAINRDLESVEVSGRKYTNPIDDVAFEEICELIAWRADIAKVPYTSWPINPHTGLSFVYNHRDFQAHKPCSGDVLQAREQEIVMRVRAILREAQTGGVVRPPGTVTPPAKVTFVAFPKLVVFHTVPMATARQYGNRSAKIIRTFKARTAIKCGGYYIGQEVGGSNRWLVIVSGKTSLNARIHASGVFEEIPDFSQATKDMK